MDAFMHGWMGGGHGWFMLLGWLIVIIVLVGLGYVMGRAGRERDKRE